MSFTDETCEAGVGCLGGSCEADVVPMSFTDETCVGCLGGSC